MSNTKELESIASQVRRDILRMVHAQSSGHPGGSLGCADFVTALYFEGFYYQFYQLQNQQYLHLLL